MDRLRGFLFLAFTVFLLLPGKMLLPGGGFSVYPMTGEFREPQTITIYLTFDDGPCKGSEEVDRLATLDSVMINVFVIGHAALSNDSMKLLFLRYENNPMIEIGNHSYSHANRKYRRYYEDAAAVLKDFAINRDSLHLENNIARLPGRNYWRVGNWRQDDIVNGKEAADSLAAHGYRIFGWDLEWRCDSVTGLSSRTGREMLDQMNRLVGEGRTFRAGNVVILLHDPQLQNAGFRAELRDFIKRAKEWGNYRIRHLSSYPSAS